MTRRLPRPGAWRLVAALVAALAGMAPRSNAVAAEAEFYKGKTITITVGVAPGGGYDLYARLAAEFLGRHIAGAPNIVVVNMPGGGGLRAALHLYTSAPRDGTTLCAIVQSVGFDSALGELAAPADAYNFIGRMTDSVEMQIMSGASPIRTLADARDKVAVVGATGASSPSAIVPKLLNDALQTRFKVVGGYPGTQESWLAMERGEVEGTLKSMQSLMASNREALESGKVRVLWQLAMGRHAGFADVPAIGELGDDDDGRAMLRLIASTAEIGRSLATPPGVPADRVRQLRDAFQAMIRDPDFQAAAARRGADIAAASGEDIQKIIQLSVQTPSAVLSRVKKDIAAR